MVEYYAYPTNYSNGTIDGPSDFFLGYPAFISNALSSLVVILFTFVTLLLLGLPFGFTTALATASFIMSVLTIYLWTSGVIGVEIVLIFIVITMASIIVAAFDKR